MSKETTVSSTVAEDDELSSSKGIAKLPWLHLLNTKTSEFLSNYKEILAREEEERKRNTDLKVDSAKAGDSDSSMLVHSVSRNESSPCGLPRQSSRDRLLENLRVEHAQTVAEWNRLSAIEMQRTNILSDVREREAARSSRSSFKPARSFANRKKVYLKKPYTTTSGGKVKIGKTNNTKPSITKLQSENHAGKKLLNMPPAVKKLFATPKKKSNMSIKAGTANDESLDIPEIEKLMINTPPTKRPEGERLTSTKEFVQLEVELQTPRAKSIEMEHSLNPDLYIERFEQIVEQQKNTLKEMEEVLTCLKQAASKNKKKVSNDDGNKENIPIATKSSSILTSSEKSDLRSDVLKRTVYYDISAKRNIEEALDNTMKNSGSILQTARFMTPTRMRQHLLDKIQLQCLILQDTPNHY